jgi:hypothetical protein
MLGASDSSEYITSRRVASFIADDYTSGTYMQAKCEKLWLSKDEIAFY